MARNNSIQNILDLTESLKDDQIIRILNKSIDYDLLCEKVSIAMSCRFKVYEEKLQVKDIEIHQLQFKNLDLEIRCTELEQYTRKNTLKIEGVVEPTDEDPFQTVLDLCSDLKLDPPIQIEDIDNCHRVGREQSDGRPRGINVKLSSYRARKRLYDARSTLADRNKALRKAQREQQPTAEAQDDVFPDTHGPDNPTGATPQPPPRQLADHPSGPRPMTRSQTANLQKPHHETTTTESTDNADSEPPSDPLHEFDSRSPLSSKRLIFINEALCKSRGKLSYACRQLKNQGKISDTWTHDGRIRIRDSFNRIAKIESAADLKKFE